MANGIKVLPKWKQTKTMTVTRKKLLQKKATKDKQRDKKVHFDLSCNTIVRYDPSSDHLAQTPDLNAKSATEQANEVQASLPCELPSFVKLMLSSHVTGSFWLGFPKKFCEAHMPKHDETVVLVDEDEQEFNTKFVVGKNKTGLGSGWKGFSIAHELIEGDALVFQLVGHWKFKVYIVRVNGVNEIDGALALLNIAPCDMNIDDFSIVVDDLIIDSEIPKDFQVKYYELCHSQNSYLHENLVKGLNVKLAAGVILQTVTVADAIRACKVGVTRDDFDTWDKTLKSFEELGMKVGFLRARISKLIGLLFESKELLETKKNEQVKVEDEMRIMSEKLCGLKDVMKNLDVEIETLGKNLELDFCKEANAPW
ncbi:B3 domain-containing protein Os01g0234100-like [Bidens hawaiensis]|uniref:B3 domain-containing protein Os01g0234100-like n=1 Tax=Bidens hawaiensis TaxID=980011 RepID=UPI004049E5D0